MAPRFVHSLLLLCLLAGAKAQQNLRDSLNQLYRSGHDTTKVQALNKISRQIEANYPDSALLLGDSALTIAQRSHYQHGMGLSYASIGSAQTTAGKYDAAIQNLLNALQVFEALKNKRAITNTYNSIANAYTGLNDLNKAFEFYRKAYNMAKQAPRSDYMVAVTSVGMGSMSLEEKKYSEAIAFFKEAEKFFGESGNANMEAMATSMIGEAYFRSGDLFAAEKYYRRVMPLFKKWNDTYSLAACLHNMGVLEMDRKNYEQAVAFLSEALQINTERKAWDNIKESALKLSESFEALGKSTHALAYYKVYMQYKDSVISIQRNKAIAEAESKYDSEKKEQQLKMKNMELESSQMQLSFRSRLLYGFAAAIIIFMLLLFFVFKQYNEKKKANLLLTNKNVEIEKQKSIIEEKNKDITDSINYARHIQQAIIPSPEELGHLFRQAFVIFKPKDVVSGDFYLLEKNNDAIYLAVVDCTGHGVPGAMLSVFANATLKNIIATGAYKNNPAGILTELCAQFKNNLHSGHNALSINDGADIGLCIYYPHKNILYYAGAKHNLYRLRNGHLDDFNANRYGISGTNTGIQTEFTDFVIDTEPSDRYYVFTDGFADQFGGPKGKKFKLKQLEELLQSSSSQSMTLQAATLNGHFEAWKGRLEQLDDVTLVGFEI